MVSDIITPGETPPGSHGLSDVAGCISITEYFVKNLDCKAAAEVDCEDLWPDTDIILAAAKQADCDERNEEVARTNRQFWAVEILMENLANSIDKRKRIRKWSLQLLNEIIEKLKRLKEVENRKREAVKKNNDRKVKSVNIVNDLLIERTVEMSEKNARQALARNKRINFQIPMEVVDSEKEARVTTQEIVMEFMSMYECMVNVSESENEAEQDVQDDLQMEIDKEEDNLGGKTPEDDEKVKEREKENQKEAWENIWKNKKDVMRRVTKKPRKRLKKEKGYGQMDGLKIKMRDNFTS